MRKQFAYFYRKCAGNKKKREKNIGPLQAARKKTPALQALERLSKKSVFTMLTLPRGSAHEIEIAQRFHKNRGRVPRFLYSQREKVSAWELSDVRVLRSQNTLVGKTKFFDSHSTSSIIASSCCMSNGLERWPFMPAFAAFWRSSSKAFAVMATMGRAAFSASGRARMARVAS